MAKKNYIRIGAGWTKSGIDKSGRPYEFISVSFEGKSEKSDYEVILRKKSTQQELSLADVGATINKNKYKTEDANPKLPDYVIQIALDTQEE